MHPAASLMLLVALLAGSEPARKEPSRDEIIAAAQDAISLSNETTPEVAVPALERALESIDVMQDRLLGDEAVLTLRREVSLSLARAYLQLEDRARAQALLYRALRDAVGQPLAIQDFGPSLTEFHAELLAEVQAMGTATIFVRCGAPCDVYIQEHKGGHISSNLVLGEYRVAIVAANDSEDPLVAQVSLERDGQVAQLDYKLPMEAPASTRDPAPTRVPIPSVRRLAPRWLEVTGVAVGGAALAVGAVLLAFDSKCPGGFEPIAEAEKCPRLYDNLISGIATASAGGALIVGFGSVVAVDEVRVRRPRMHAVMLGWRFRF